MLSRLATNGRAVHTLATGATSIAAARRACVALAPRLVIAPTRRVSTDKSLQDQPVAGAVAATTQRAPRAASVPLYGVPLENMSLSTDDDSELTLGEEVKRHHRQPAASFVDMRIGDVLRAKSKYGHTLHSINESESVAKALQAMNHFQIGAILVTSDSDPHSIVGIFSSRDLIRCVDDGVLGAIDAKRLTVSEVMSRDPVFAYSDTTALQAMHMMNEAGFRHLPVRDRGSKRTIGLISIGDLVRTVLAEHEQKNEFLENMISGKYPA